MSTWDVFISSFGSTHCKDKGQSRSSAANSYSTTVSWHGFWLRHPCQLELVTGFASPLDLHWFAVQISIKQHFSLGIYSSNWIINSKGMYIPSEDPSLNADSQQAQLCRNTTKQVPSLIPTVHTPL